MFVFNGFTQNKQKRNSEIGHRFSNPICGLIGFSEIKNKEKGGLQGLKSCTDLLELSDFYRVRTTGQSNGFAQALSLPTVSEAGTQGVNLHMHTQACIHACNAMPRHAMPCNAMQCKALQSKAMQCNTVMDAHIIICA